MKVIVFTDYFYFQKAKVIHQFCKMVMRFSGKLVYYLPGVLILFAACKWISGPDELLKKYGEKWDPVRKKVGLFLISGHIKEYLSTPDKGNAYIIYYNFTGQEYNDSCKIHQVQQYIRSDSLLEECDHIYGKFMDRTPDGNYREQLDYDYYFYDCTIDYKFHKKGWECQISNSRQFGFLAEIPKKTADSLLKDWNVIIDMNNE